LRCRIAAARIGKILIGHRCTVVGSTNAPRSAIGSGQQHRLAATEPVLIRTLP
jgi:hypothetical protein